VGEDTNVSCWIREKEKGKLVVEELLQLWRKKEKQLVGREKSGSVYGGIGGWRWLWEEEGETFGWEQKGEVGREEREACSGSS